MRKITPTTDAKPQQISFGTLQQINAMMNVIQDDFMRGDYNISSDKIVIGKDVTDKEQQGAIVIDQGHLGINGSRKLIDN